jgi:hypothetical protein
MSRRSGIWHTPAIAGVAALLTGFASSHVECQAQEVVMSDDSPRTIETLEHDMTPLAQAFNAHTDRWRVVALVSPTCSACVLGAEAVQKELVARYPADELDTIVVWIPMLRSDNETAARAASAIFQPQRATLFYDARQAVGWAYARHSFAGFVDRARRSIPEGHWLAPSFENRADDRPQWDLYMLYAPGIRWTDEAPPEPTHWIRHCGRTNHATSVFWRDSIDDGPREADLHRAMREMADDAMKPTTPPRIEIIGFENCPNVPLLRANVAKSLAAMGVETRAEFVDLESLAPDDDRRRWPSPTVLIDAKDLFGMPAPESTSVTCRLYRGGVPSEDDIVEAMASYLEDATRK